MPPTIWWKAASTLFMVSLRSREGRLFGLFVFANLDHARFGSDLGTKVERAFVLVGWRNFCVAPLPAINLNRKEICSFVNVNCKNNSNFIVLIAIFF